MKQKNALRFGEQANDTVKVVDRFGNEQMHNGPVFWGPKYEDARNAADQLIKKFGLAEEDFWIKKSWDWDENAVVYTNLILSHAGCQSINKQLPDEKRFIPTCVSEGRGTEGGVVLFYKSDAQGIFEVGEASPRNNGFAFVYSIAKNRLFDRVVLANAGAVGIYGEEEAEDFKKFRNVSTGSQPQIQQPIVPQPAKAMATSETPSAVLPDSEFLKRVSGLKKAIAFTEANEKKLLDFYDIFSLEEISKEDLADAEKKLAVKVARKKRELQLQQAAQAAGAPLNEQPVMPQPSAQPQQMPQGLSPVAQMMMAQANANTQPASQQAPAPQAEPQIPLGQTVYHCLDGAPEEFVDLNGQTLDQIGKAMLKPLFGRKNAFGRRYVSEEMLGKIVEYISA